MMDKKHVILYNFKQSGIGNLCTHLFITAHCNDSTISLAEHTTMSAPTAV
jgi:hypothetical protein